MKNLLLAGTWMLCLLASTFNLSAQDAKPVASPRDSVSGKVLGATITINYGSPSVKGRTIWGDLVPYGKVWRAGANEATRFTTDKNIMVQGKNLAAGTYSFFVIPTEKEWTIIFNKTANQWGAYKYDQAQDALRVSVSTKPITDGEERLKYTIRKTGFSLIWENIELPVAIKL